MARHKRPKRKVTRTQIFLQAVGLMAVLSIIVSMGSIAVLEQTKSKKNKILNVTTTRVAFGSGTSWDYGPQPIWVEGVIPSNPDAWIWLGDMAYMDKPRVNCEALPWHQECNCSSSWLHLSNHSCMSGNPEFASSRAEVQLSNPNYAQFMAFMCPGHRVKGLHPPTGSDPSICPRHILGTYDDHDYGWEQGNKRLPRKDQLKQTFLDAIGEPLGSSRRQIGHGIEYKHTLNEEKGGQEIDVYLLDERFYRDTLPCHTRKSFCEKVALTDVHHPKHAWCLDFLQGGELQNGSCCTKDDHLFYGWCLQPSNREDPWWDVLCSAKSPNFGHINSTVLKSYLAHDELNDTDDSPFCEVLGARQRNWFEDAVSQSNASLKLVVSSSVVIGNALKKSCEDLDSISSDIECPCFGDDWECYKPAQLHLLSFLSRIDGCVVLLTGGFEYSDIRVLRPGEHNYTEYYGGIQFPYPLYQVMASGLTMTAKRNFSCDVLRQDPLRVRDHAECDFVRAPSFGMVEVVWEHDPIVKLQIRDGMTGAIKLESSLKISTCLLKPVHKTKAPF